MRQRRSAEPIRPEESSNRPSDIEDVVHESREWGEPLPKSLYAAGDEDGEGNDDLFGQCDEMVGQGEVIELEEEEECAPRRTAPEPGEPTAEEIADHRVDHLPYRCWCGAPCIEGQGYGEQHRQGPEGAVPIISFDYLIITKRGIFWRDATVEKSAILIKIMVVKVSKSKYIGSHVVPVKGLGGDRYAAEKLRGDILWLGYSRVLLKSDNEPAILALMKDVLKALKVEVLDQAAPDHPPPHDSRVNGSVENAVRQVQGLLPTEDAEGLPGEQAAPQDTV